MKNLLLTIIVSLSLPVSALKAGSVTLDDFATTISLNSVTISNTISAIWGTYSAGVFTPLLSTTQSADNTGYFDGSLGAGNGELNAIFAQTDNSIISVATPMFLSIFNVAGGAGTSVWTSSIAQIVLSDPAWTAPTFTFTDPSASWGLSANTIANPLSAFGGSTGTFSFNGGSPQISLVPEPSTYALLALSGLAFGGYVILRRRRA